MVALRGFTQVGVPVSPRRYGRVSTVVCWEVFERELPMTALAEWGKHGLQSNTLALAVESGTEGFDSPLS